MPTHKRTARRIAGILATVSAAVSAFGQAPSTDTFVKKALAAPSEGRINLLVQNSRSMTGADAAKLAHLGGYVYRHLPIVKSNAINIPTKKLRKLLSLPFVSHVSEDVSVRKSDVYTVESSGASTAWQQYSTTGSGVGVAIIDSGIRPDNDFGFLNDWDFTDLLNNRIVANANFSPDSFFANDLCGHGTHVAGIVGGNGKSSSARNCFVTYYGIAPEANLINVRVLDSQGSGTVSQVIAGIQWTVNHKKSYNIRVMNLSMGHTVGESYTTDPLCQAVEQAWKSGIVVVCSAGNDGRKNATQTSGADNEGYGANYGTIESPGNDPYVITVGAMKQGDVRNHDQIATYSSRGPSRLDFVVKPDIVAAGNRVVSVLARYSYLDRTYGDVNGVSWTEYMTSKRDGMSHDYFRLSGTSMAAPVVSGAVALMLQLQPKLSPDTVKARLMASADKWLATSGRGDMFTYGAGYLNIPAALDSAIVATQYATSPRAYRRSDGSVAIDMDRAMWGTGMSGNRAMWGDGAMSGTQPDTVSPNRAMWGDDVWTDPTVTTVNSATIDLSSTAIKGD
ncbi:S8 family peptidase [Fimbriimonas ginsengisoli]|uniref:Alkaline serine protease n=1 Tax=Fimbriimonas ginsengisoli Gsoil 348 TaxID=661478 RepID=A0A068NRV0_FIMGI|nr:S8 family peptidase [Fimbriimonas ginsengisoli]AIE84349.1 alkaline serine protease [Fimbriimonas ginsengisoli Gsoil 348]